MLPLFFFIMRTLYEKLDCKGKPITIIPLADLHIGDKHADTELIKIAIRSLTVT